MLKSNPSNCDECFRRSRCNSAFGMYNCPFGYMATKKEKKADFFYALRNFFGKFF